MSVQQFKSDIKKVSSHLKGLTLQVVNGKDATPYKSLRAFGNAILNAEANGKEIRISQVWTSAGVMPISSFNQFYALLLCGMVTAVQFKAYSNPSNMVDYLRTSFGTND